MADDDVPSLKHFVYERVRMMIDSGLSSKKEVFDAISQELADNPELAAEGAKMRGYAAKRWTAREAEERTWTERTDNDRLDAAFAALDRAGFVALQNAGWTMTTGWEDCWFECARRRERGESPRGAVFYHTQDLERGVAGQGLMMAYGVFHEADDGDLAGNAQVAAEVCRILGEQGVATQWDGDPKVRIQVPPFPWRRRRHTTAPPEPGPWRRFRHPDGRTWHLRLAGATIELRLTLAGEDEPLHRRRSHADACAAQAAAEALVNEQLADGFTEEGATG